jgi:hypothetical protein
MVKRLNHVKSPFWLCQSPMFIHFCHVTAATARGCRRMIGSPGQMGWFRLRTATWIVNVSPLCLMIYYSNGMCIGNCWMIVNIQLLMSTIWDQIDLLKNIWRQLRRNTHQAWVYHGLSWVVQNRSQNTNKWPIEKTRCTMKPNAVT